MSYIKIISIFTFFTASCESRVRIEKNEKLLDHIGRTIKNIYKEKLRRMGRESKSYPEIFLGDNTIKIDPRYRPENNTLKSF